MLTVLITSPRVAPGLLSWPAWEALRSAAAVLAPPGHPQRPALDEAGIGYRISAESGLESLAPDADVVWLAEPGYSRACRGARGCCMAPPTCRAPGCST